MSTLRNYLFNIRTLFAGNSFELIHMSPEMQEMLDEMYEINISFAGEDKKNLKEDRKKVVKDYAKAYEEKKLQLEY